MTISKAKIDSWNKELFNGFNFDVYHFVESGGDKQANKTIRLDDGNFVKKYCLTFVREKDKSEKEGWQFEENYTKRFVPAIFISTWKKKGSIYSNDNGFLIYEVGEPTNKKMFKILQKLSETLTLEKLTEIESKQPDRRI